MTPSVDQLPDAAAESLSCSECATTAAADEAERQGWRFLSDGLGELLPFCRACCEREFGL